jgi:hypothetical protein
MASQTAEHAHPAAAQAPPKVPPAKRAEPILFEDIDKVLLVRVFGEDVDISAAKAKALAQGVATAKAGDELEASRIEFDPAATGVQRKQAAVARAQATVKAAEHGTPQEKEAAAAELKRAQSLPG